MILSVSRIIRATDKPKMIQGVATTIGTGDWTFTVQRGGVWILTGATYKSEEAARQAMREAIVALRNECDEELGRIE